MRTVGSALALFALGSATVLTTNTALVVIGLFCAGVAIPWLVVAMGTTRQQATPPRLQGRSAAATNMALSLPQLASIAVGAALDDAVDYRWLGGSVVVVLSATAASLLLRHTPVRSPTVVSMFGKRRSCSGWTPWLSKPDLITAPTGGIR